MRVASVSVEILGHRIFAHVTMPRSGWSSRGALERRSHCGRAAVCTTAAPAEIVGYTYIQLYSIIAS
jgi:hypothetical protein